jgi:hypothetical protein
MNSKRYPADGIRHSAQRRDPPTLGGLPELARRLQTLTQRMRHAQGQHLPATATSDAISSSPFPFLSHGAPSVWSRFVPLQGLA